MKKTLLVLMMAMAVAGCVEPLDVGLALSNNALVLSACQDGDIDTKAPLTGTTFPTDRDMVVSAYSNASSSTLFTGTTFSHDGTLGGWKGTVSRMWPASGTTDFLAYSCPGLSPTVTWNSSNASAGITSFVLPNNWKTQSDLLFGAASGCTYSSTSIPTLTFKHALAQIVVTAKAAVPYDGTNGVTIRNVVQENTFFGGTCSVTRSGNNVSISWGSLNNRTHAYMNELTGLSFPYGVSSTTTQIGVGFLVPPQAIQPLYIWYTTYSGGVGTNRSYEYYPSSISSWEMGKRYTYAVEFDASGNIGVCEGVEDLSDVTRNYMWLDNTSVKQVGSNFSLASGQYVFWRPDSKSNYEKLTYMSGTYGSSVVFAGETGVVTVTKSGSNYSVSWEPVQPVKLLVEVDRLGWYYTDNTSWSYSESYNQYTATVKGMDFTQSLAFRFHFNVQYNNGTTVQRVAVQYTGNWRDYANGIIPGGYDYAYLRYNEGTNNQAYTWADARSTRPAHDTYSMPFSYTEGDYTVSVTIYYRWQN